MEDNLEDRNLYLFKDISNESTSEIIKVINKINVHDQNQLNKLKKYVVQPIILNIQSNGGNVDDMWALVDVIQSSKTPIITLCCGYCKSAAAIIFLSGHVRVICKNGTIMFHQMTCATNQKINDFSLKEQQFLRMHKRMMKFIKKHCNLPKNYLKKLDIQKEDVYLTAKECLAFNICDVKIKRSSPAISNILETFRKDC